MRLHYLLLAAGLAVIAQGTPVRKTVCESGCDYTLTQFQKALDEAADYQNRQACREYIIEIEAGKVITGTFTLPRKSVLWDDGGAPVASPCRKFVTVRSNATSLPAPGTRLRKTEDADRLVRFIGPATSTGGQILGTTANGGTGYWRFRGLEFSIPSGSMYYSLVRIGRTDIDTEYRLLPHHIEFEHVWIHGNDNEEGPNQGIHMNCTVCSLRDSIVEEVHSTTSDAAAVLLMNTTGPVRVMNNYLAGAGQNWFSGGAAPGVTAVRGVVPTHLTIVGNHMEKPFRWKYTTSSANPSGTCWDEAFHQNTGTGAKFLCVNGMWQTSTLNRKNYMVKPTIETKNARGVRIYGNYLDKGWMPSRGQSHNFYLANQVDNNTNPVNRAPWTRIEDIEMTANRAEGGVGLFTSGLLASGYWVYTNEIRIRHNLVTGLADTRADAAGLTTRGRSFSIVNNNGDVQFEHNTILLQPGGTAAQSVAFPSAANTMRGLHVLRDNIMPHATFSFVGGPVVNGMCQYVQAMSAYGAYDVRRNVMSNESGAAAYLNSNYCGGTQRFPLDHAFPSSWSGVVDAAAGYRVRPTYAAAYHNALDGSDVGANIDWVESATRGAISGVRNTFLDMRIRAVIAAANSATIRYTAPSTAACDLKVDTNAGFGSDRGQDSHQRKGKEGVVTVSGLEPATLYFVRLSCGTDRLETEFHTR